MFSPIQRGPGRLVDLERRLPYTVTILDRFQCNTDTEKTSYNLAFPSVS